MRIIQVIVASSPFPALPDPVLKGSPKATTRVFDALFRLELQVFAFKVQVYQRDFKEEFLLQ